VLVGPWQYDNSRTGSKVSSWKLPKSKKEIVFFDISRFIQSSFAYNFEQNDSTNLVHVLLDRRVQIGTACFLLDVSWTFLGMGLYKLCHNMKNSSLVARIFNGSHDIVMVSTKGSESSLTCCVQEYMSCGMARLFQPIRSACCSCLDTSTSTAYCGEQSTNLHVTSTSPASLPYNPISASIFVSPTRQYIDNTSTNLNQYKARAVSAIKSRHIRHAHPPLDCFFHAREGNHIQQNKQTHPAHKPIANVCQLSSQHKIVYPLQSYPPTVATMRFVTFLSLFALAQLTSAQEDQGAATTIAATQQATITTANSLFTLDGTTSASFLPFTQTFAKTALGTWDLGPTPLVGSIGLGTIQGSYGVLPSTNSKRAFDAIQTLGAKM
jgi:hypothetical protein